MTQIQKLDSAVVDQIAAGEVVERPSHLVKELVENAIDAGATRVAIEVNEGGRQVKIVDDGSGMSATDLPKSIERFATSKIQKAEDLWKLKSFGFRGEALASIASVSRLTMISREKNASTGYRLFSEFGQAKPVEVSGGSFGTTVYIQDLFENVPARLKFMKSDAAEVAQIKTVIKAIALAHPSVEFQLTVEGQMSLLYPKSKDLKSRCQQVLEQDELFEAELIEPGKLSDNSIRVHAVFSGPSQISKTSRQIWIFAQNRWIQDRSLQTAVIEAYRHLLMHGEYPMAVVKIEMPTEEVDVNIHPTKSQVKFLDPQMVFRAVHHCIKNVLNTAPWMKKHQSSVNVPPPQSQTVEVTNLKFQDEVLNQVQYQKKDFFFPKPTNLGSSVGSTSVETSTSYSNANVGFRSSRESFADIFQSSNKTNLGSATKQQNFWSRLEVLGQAALTYIIAQSDQALYLVDQHAAHERVQFEKLMKGYQDGKFEVQDYLFPLVMDFSPEQVEVFLSLTAAFQKLGISMEQMGPQSLGIKSAPAFLKESSITKALDKMAVDITTHGHLYSFESSVGDIIATMACHSSVRAGQSLSIIEMRELLHLMDDFPLSSYCPHGRPVMIEQSFQKIETDFGRRGS